MTREETDKILFILRATYPEVFAKYTAKDVSMMATVWQRLLDGYTYDQVSTGVETYIKTDIYGKMPKVGQIIDAMSKLGTPAMNVNEAWTLVSKAIGRSSYYAEEEFEKLKDPVIKKAVGSAENLRQYAAMNISDVQVTVKAHFKNAYETELKRQEEAKKLSPNLFEAITEHETEKIEG